MKKNQPSDTARRSAALFFAAATAPQQKKPPFAEQIAVLQAEAAPEPSSGAGCAAPLFTSRKRQKAPQIYSETS